MEIVASTYPEMSVEIEGSYDPHLGFYDHQINDLSIMVPNRKSGGQAYVPASLLEGVNKDSPDVKKLLSNLLYLLDIEAWDDAVRSKAFIDGFDKDSF